MDTMTPVPLPTPPLFTVFGLECLPQEQYCSLLLNIYHDTAVLTTCFKSEGPLSPELNWPCCPFLLHWGAAHVCVKKASQYFLITVLNGQLQMLNLNRTGPAAHFFFTEEQQGSVSKKRLSISSSQSLQPAADAKFESNWPCCPFLLHWGAAGVCVKEVSEFFPFLRSSDQGGADARATGADLLAQVAQDVPGGAGDTETSGERAGRRLGRPAPHHHRARQSAWAHQGGSLTMEWFYAKLFWAVRGGRRGGVGWKW